MKINLYFHWKDNCLVQPAVILTSQDAFANAEYNYAPASHFYLKVYDTHMIFILLDRNELGILLELLNGIAVDHTLDVRIAYNKVD